MQLDRELVNRSFHWFVRLSWRIIEPAHEFVDAWHVGCLAEHLDAVMLGQIQRLVVNFPPRCSKSQLISVLWQPYVWTKNPSARWIFGCYSPDLAIRDTVLARDLIRTEWYQSRWPMELKEDQNRLSWFSNQSRGSRIATGVTGGRSTGHGCDYLIGDDTLKAQDVYYPAKVEVPITWWTKAMATRADDFRTMRRVISQQRLSERDLSGWAWAEKMGYQHLVLPMRYDPKRYSLPQDDPDKIEPTSLQKERPELIDGPDGSGRSEPGDLLFPERIPQDIVDELDKELGVDADFQLDQRVARVAGNIFQKEHLKDFAIRFLADGRLDVSVGMKVWPIDQLRFFQTVDTASGSTDESDYSVVGTYALTPDIDLLVWHIWRLQVRLPEQLAMLACARIGEYEYRDGHFVSTGRLWPGPIVLQGVEASTIGMHLLQSAHANGTPLHPLQASGHKELRASTVAQMARIGKVYLNQSGDWRLPFIRELLVFPRGRYDDQVDSFAYAGIMATHDAILRSGWGDLESVGAAAADPLSDKVIVHVGGHEIALDMPEEGRYPLLNR